MNSTTNFEVDELPWDEILAQFYKQYDDILERHLKNYTRYYKAIFELLRHTHIEIEYDPKLEEKQAASKNDQEGINFWNSLVDEINQELRNILIEEHGVAEEYANAIQVGNIGAIFLSHLGFRHQSCTELHICGSGRRRFVSCPC